MSSCSVSVCLLVLLGAVMAFGNPVAVSKGISQLLRLDDQEIGSKPLFSSVLNNINTSCQRKEDIVLLNATLDVYMRIFSSILHSHDHHHSKAGASTLLGQLSKKEVDEVKQEVKELREKMVALRGRLSSFNDNREELIAKLNSIKVNDPNDQRRALAEYNSVLRAASLISPQS